MERGSGEASDVREARTEQEIKVRQVTDYQATWTEQERGAPGAFTFQLILDHGAEEYVIRPDAEAAEAVRKLRKPTVAAWAANQLVRRHRKDVDALLHTGEELRSAHERLLADGDEERVAEAVAAERAAARRLVERARRLEGLSDATLERLAETLHAAAGDHELREELRRGAVTRERTAAMFGGLAAGAPAQPRGGRSAHKPARKPKAGARRAERERAERERREERERQDRLKAARAELRRLRSDHGRSRRALDSAERRLARAREELDDREGEADAAREREASARRELADAEREVERLED